VIAFTGEARKNLVRTKESWPRLAGQPRRRPPSFREDEFKGKMGVDARDRPGCGPKGGPIGLEVSEV